MRQYVADKKQIMYKLYPPPSWFDFKRRDRPGQKRDRQGQPMVEKCPRPGTAPRALLDFPILRGIDKVRYSPNFSSNFTRIAADKMQISTKVEWWWVEAMFRLDPRLEWSDIDMRMEHVGDREILTQPKFINNLNNMCSRARERFSMISWREKSKQNKPNKIRDNVIQRLNQQQLNDNTTRGTTPGLVDPSNASGPRIPVPVVKAGRSVKRPAANAVQQVAAQAGPSTRKRKAAPLSFDNEDDQRDSEPEWDEKSEPTTTPKRRRIAITVDSDDDFDAGQIAEWNWPSPTPDLDLNHGGRIGALSDFPGLDATMEQATERAVPSRKRRHNYDSDVEEIDDTAPVYGSHNAKRMRTMSRPNSQIYEAGIQSPDDSSRRRYGAVERLHDRRSRRPAPGLTSVYSQLTPVSYPGTVLEQDVSAHMVPETVPKGSSYVPRRGAVESLHQDRSRRPAPRSTTWQSHAELPFDPRTELTPLNPSQPFNIEEALALFPGPESWEDTRFLYTPIVMEHSGESSGPAISGETLAPADSQGVDLEADLTFEDFEKWCAENMPTEEPSGAEPAVNLETPALDAMIAAEDPSAADPASLETPAFDAFMEAMESSNQLAPFVPGDVSASATAAFGSWPEFDDQFLDLDQALIQSPVEIESEVSKSASPERVAPLVAPSPQPTSASTSGMPLPPLAHAERHATVAQPVTGKRKRDVNDPVSWGPEWAVFIEEHDPSSLLDACFPDWIG